MVTPPCIRATPVAQQRVLQAIADPLRQSLLQVMLKQELSVSELVGIFRHPQSSISRHLKVLRGAGLVAARRDGTLTFYRGVELDDAPQSLEALLLNWLKCQPTSRVIEERLQRTLRRRRDEATGFFDQLATQWDALRAAAFGDAFAFEAFIGLLPPDWTVVDVGTGTGFLLPALAGHFREVVAVEASPAMLECARQRFAAQESDNVSFQLGNLEHLSICDQACDLAVACLGLHHIAAPENALAEMHRIVKPLGSLLIVEQEEHEFAQFHEAMQDRWWGFDGQRLSDLVEQVGFRRVRRRRLSSAHSASGAAESPGLFAITAQRAGS